MIQVCVRPEDVKKVRGLILSLAISGKITSKEVSSEDISGTFFIPSDWKWCTLSEIAACRGSAKAGSDGIKPSDWILDMEDIDGATGTVHTRATFKERSSLSTKSAFKPGDVLYGKLRPYLNKVVLADSPGFCTTEIIPITPGATIESRYLQLVLRSPYFLTYVAKRSYGMKMPRLGTKDLESARIPRPPLAEQKRIVAKVDELMALCDRLEAQLKERDVKQAALAKAALAKFSEDPTQENLQLLFHPSFSIETADLRKSILNLAVQGKLCPQDANDEIAEKTFDGLKALSGDSYDGGGAPSQWVHCSYRSLTTLVTSGSRGWKEFYAEKGSIFVRTQNIKTDKLVLDDVAFVDLPKSAEGMRAQVLRDDILVTITGANVTKAARIEETIPEAYVSQHIALTRPRWSKMSEWLHLCFISHGSARGVLERLAYGDKPGLNLNNIRDLVIPIPPYAEQLRVVEKVKQLMALVDALEKQLEASQTTGEKLLEAMVAELTTD